MGYTVARIIGRPLDKPWHGPKTILGNLEAKQRASKNKGHSMKSWLEKKNAMGKPSKRITAKQRAARQRNIKIAQRSKRRK